MWQTYMCARHTSITKPISFFFYFRFCSTLYTQLKEWIKLGSYFHIDLVLAWILFHWVDTSTMQLQMPISQMIFRKRENCVSCITFHPMQQIFKSIYFTCRISISNKVYLIDSNNEMHLKSLLLDTELEIEGCTWEIEFTFKAAEVIACANQILSNVFWVSPYTIRIERIQAMK